jgi:hypothetical protein
MQRRNTNIPFLQSIDYLNHNPAVTKVLILDRSVMTYYSDKNVIKAFGQWWEQVFPDARTGQEVLPKIESLGVSHVLDVVSPDSGFQIPAGYPGLSLVFEAPNQRVYKVSGGAIVPQAAADR